MAKRTFEMNNKQYNSMMDIARDLGVKRIYPKDFEKYGIVEITETDDKENNQPVKQVIPEKTEKVVKKSEDKEIVKSDKKKEEIKTDRRFTRKVGTDEQIQEVQSKVNNMSIDEFSSFVKHFSVESLVKMAETIGVNLWDSISNEPIRRMRLLMEIKNFYFPNEKVTVKPSSCWKKIELSKLIELAKTNKIEYKNSDDIKIQRMRIIMALNSAGLTPDNLPKEETANA